MGLWNPDWHMGCTVPGDPHDCKTCSWKQLKGELVNRVLAATQATQRIPLVPIPPEDLTGCGEFGWELRRPLRLDPHECDFSDGDGFGDLELKMNCGVIQCETFCPAPVYCDPVLIVAWDARHADNQIMEARIEFEQAELCNPTNGPCDRNPCRDSPEGCVDEQPHPPASAEVIMRVRGHIRIGIRIRAADATRFPNCDCCRPTLAWDHETIIIDGDFDEHMAWGKLQPSWDGYRLAGGDYIDYGWADFWGTFAPPFQPAPHDCAPTDPDAPSPPGMCMGPFCNQGKWTDATIGADGTPWYYEPPKACPSHVIQDMGWDQFYCPPMVRWTSNIGNKVDYTVQCWDVEAVRNIRACVDGTDDRDLAESHRYECTPLECRRGCTIGHAARDISPIDCGKRAQPCIEEAPPMTDAIPWSCGQCMRIEPERAIAFPGVCCVGSECRAVSEHTCGKLGGTWRPDQNCAQVVCE
jgi:hypothetical protein